MAANEENEGFAPSSFRIFLMIASLAAICAIGLIWWTDGSDIHIIGIAIASVALIYGGATWARRLAALYPVHVNPAGSP